MASRVVVEWTRSSLRLVLAEGRGARWKIKGIHSQVTGDITEALKALLKKAARSGDAQVIGVVSREQVITRVVKFPTTQAAELAQMAELYAKAQLPYPREQLVMDSYVLSQEAGFSTVAIVACQRDLIDRQLAVLRGAGLSVDFLTVSSWGVLGWYRHLLARAGPNFRVGADKEPCLVLNIDDARTDLVLINQGRVLSSRSIGQGVQDWTLSLAEAGELLSLEVERSRAAIRKELPGTEVRSVLLTGLGPLPQWREQLAQRLSLPAAAVSVDQTLKEAGGGLMQSSPIVAAGLASSDSRELLNLSPAEVRVQVRHRQQVKELAIVSALALAAVALGSAVLAVRVFRQRQLIVQLDQLVARIEPDAKQVQERTRATQLVDSVLRDRGRFVSTLAGIFRSTPSGITLDALTFERSRKELVLRGSAPTTQEVLDFIKNLEQLDQVAGVDLRYSTRRSTPSGERTDFELMVRPAERLT